MGRTPGPHHRRTRPHPHPRPSWTLPRTTLIVVDDADHLHPDHLHWIAENAGVTNTKLLRITARRPTP